MKTMRSLFVLSLVAATLLPAQTPRRAKPRRAPAAEAAQATTWPIGSIVIEGNRNYTDEQIIRATGLRIGQVAGQAEFDAARDRLLATGVFETVGYKYEPSAADKSKYAAVFDVVEIAQVYPFRTEELGLDDAAVKKWLAGRDPLFAEKMPATEQKIRQYAAEVEAFAAKQGKTAKVLGRLMPDPLELTVIFRPANLPAVAEIAFTGNKVIDTLALQRAVQGAGIGAIFTERRFQAILDSSVRPLYEAQGHVRVAFPKITAAPAKNVDGIAVTVVVEEGPVYKLGRIELTGVDKPAERIKEARFKQGDVVNFENVNGGVETILAALRKGGYLRAEAKTDRRINDTTRVVDLAIHVTAGPQFRMGKLAIEGLDITTEPHVRRLWAVKPGQPFDGGYPDFFLKRIREDGIFENLGSTKSNVKLDEQNLIADVTLQFGKGTELPRIGPDADDKRRRY